jgi:hypothetical protein
MKHSTRIAIALIACLPLSACKTTESAYTPSAAKSYAASRGNTPRFEENQAYIEYVQRNAVSRGIDLVWINKPYKRISADKAGENSPKE